MITLRAFISAETKVSEAIEHEQISENGLGIHSPTFQNNTYSDSKCQKTKILPFPCTTGIGTEELHFVS